MTFKLALEGHAIIARKGGSLGTRLTFIHMCIYIRMCTSYDLLAVSMFGAEIGVWNLMVVITFPIFTVKEFMHVVKAVVGFQDIAAIDVRQRRKQN